MAIRPQGRKRTLSKKVSSFNMYMDQVYEIRVIMESTGASALRLIKYPPRLARTSTAGMDKTRSH